MSEHELILTPIQCNHITRDPFPHEMAIAGNNQMLECRIDFHFWNGSEWIEYGCGETVPLNRVTVDNIKTYKEKMEHDCWRWFANMLQKGEIEHGEPGSKITSEVLAVARYPIYFKEEST